MKVGIMSMQRVVNYGSFLQAWGLKKTIEELGHTVEFADYKPEPPLVKAPAAQGSNNSIIKRAFNMLSPTYRSWRKKQLLLNSSFREFYERFNREFIPMLGINGSNYCPELDALVIGSDEVFNCTQPGEAVGYSLQLFGKDNHARKLISYAASFGSTTLEKLEHYGKAGEIGELLSHFDAISVRDSNSMELIEKLCGKKPLRHIDPVLVYDFPEIDSIRITEKNYLVVYAYADRITEAETAAIRSFAAKKGLQIISLGFYQPFCDKYIPAAPFEVMAYVKNADYIVTDTFHGSVFSIKYQRPFATIIRESNRQKLGDLLELFKLDDRCVRSLDDLDTVLEGAVDALQIKTVLNTYQASARKYLAEQLSSD